MNILKSVQRLCYVNSGWYQFSNISNIFTGSTTKVFVSSFFAYSSIVLEKDTIEHNDYTFTEAIYNSTNQDPGDALPPEACLIRGELEDLLVGQVLLLSIKSKFNTDSIVSIVIVFIDLFKENQILLKL